MSYDKTTQRTSHGHYLLAWRKHRGMTQAELAARIGIARSYLTKIERGDRRYDQPFLEGAAEALGCTVQDLLSRDPAESEGIAELWASLTASEQRRALAVLRAMFPKAADTSMDSKAEANV
jgi:transcriptional regulator with XRE-family HTH domain